MKWEPEQWSTIEGVDDGAAWILDSFPMYDSFFGNVKEHEDLVDHPLSY